LPLDVSYGLYLYGFPVQQLMVWMGFGFAGSAIAALLAVTALAIASALLVERPALLRSHQFRPPEWMRRPASEPGSTEQHIIADDVA
jgi:peptidoglycan/LPS O-acetylase OafA/YrhL